MLYTFAVLRSPLKVVPDPTPVHGHYFGGTCEGLGIESGLRFARILTLDLKDPALGFLRLRDRQSLPLIMDFVDGAIDYSIQKDGTLVLHSTSASTSESLLESALPRYGARLEPIPYEQYRAAIFASAGPDQGYLSEQDLAALHSLGDTYTQVGGSHARASTYQPYCANPSCEGHGTQVTQKLATIAQVPAPGVSLEFLPYDPAMEFTFCANCHSISGAIVPD